MDLKDPVGGLGWETIMVIFHMNFIWLGFGSKLDKVESIIIVLYGNDLMKPKMSRYQGID